MKSCVACKHSIDDQARLCPYCGADPTTGEKVDTQERVPAGFARSGVNDRRIWTLGASWKPLPQIVVKADYQDRGDAADTAVDQFNLALGYIF